MIKNIVLIGMRGSGKSTIGQLLAKTLGREYVETDTLVSERAGKSIREIVHLNGWETFRQFEQEVVGAVAHRQDCIIATGGGIVLRQENINQLKENSVIVWLEAPIDTLLTHIGQDANRPFLTGAKTMKEDLENTLQARRHLYETAADYTIHIRGKSEEDIVQEIIALIHHD